MNKRKVQGSKVGKKERHSPYGFFLPGILIACTLKIFPLALLTIKDWLNSLIMKKNPRKLLNYN